MSKVKLGFMGALIVALISLGYAYRGEVQKAAQRALSIDQLEQAVQAQQDELKRREREKAQLERLLLDYQQQVDEIGARFEATRREVRELERENEAVADWADDPIPRELLDLERVRDE